jgi:hypothetical protein
MTSDQNLQDAFPQLEWMKDIGTATPRRVRFRPVSKIFYTMAFTVGAGFFFFLIYFAIEILNSSRISNFYGYGLLAVSMICPVLLIIRINRLFNRKYLLMFGKPIRAKIFEIYWTKSS